MSYYIIICHGKVKIIILCIVVEYLKVGAFNVASTVRSGIHAIIDVYILGLHGGGVGLSGK